MHIVTVNYEDFNGNKKSKELYFNLSESELIEMEMSTAGGIYEMINRASKAEDGATIMKSFKDIILRSYGVKSLDGDRFVKSDEIRDSFCQSNAYNTLFMDLVTDANKASAFINSLIPPEFLKKLEAKLEAAKTAN